MGEMTNDTKRALTAIAPVANVLGIEVSADDLYLYCNGQRIGIECNSTYATVNEFLAYAITWLARKEYRFREIPTNYMEKLTRYWVKGEKDG